MLFHFPFNISKRESFCLKSIFREKNFLKRKEIASGTVIAQNCKALTLEHIMWRALSAVIIGMLSLVLLVRRLEASNYHWGISVFLSRPTFLALRQHPGWVKFSNSATTVIHLFFAHYLKYLVPYQFLHQKLIGFGHGGLIGHETQMKKLLIFLDFAALLGNLTHLELSYLLDSAVSRIQSRAPCREPHIELESPSHCACTTPARAQILSPPSCNPPG